MPNISWTLYRTNRLCVIEFSWLRTVFNMIKTAHSQIRHWNVLSAKKTITYKTMSAKRDNW